MEPEDQTKWVNIIYDLIQQYGIEIEQIIDNKKTKCIVSVKYNQIIIEKKTRNKNYIQFDLDKCKVNDPGRNELVVSNDTNTIILTFKKIKYKEVVKIVLDRFIIN
jgi:hypothetical protein